MNGNLTGWQGKRHLLVLPLVLALLLATLALGGSAAAQEAPDGPNTPDGGYQVSPPVDPTPNSNPVGTLRETTAELGVLAADRKVAKKVKVHLRHAARHSQRALERYSDVDSNLPRTLASTRSVLRALDRADRFNRDPDIADAIGRQQTRLVAMAREIAAGILEVATAAGVDRRTLARAEASLAAGDIAATNGNHAGAVGYYGNTLKAGNSIAFDPAVFRSNIESTLDGQTTGYAVALARQGKLVNSATWANGLRRTPLDPPTTASSTATEINIASVSKTITAASVLYLIQDQVLGDTVDIDDPIGPYLPYDWTVGDGVAEITFRELLTHRSGLANNTAGGLTSFSGIQGFVATDITMALDTDGKYPFVYQNANFALFRILLPYMTAYTSSIGQHCNINPDFCPIGTAQSTAESYRFYVQCAVFTVIGLSEPYVPLGDDLYGCEGPDLAPNLDEGVQTLLYWGAGFNGFVNGDWTLTGGGGGWYLSAEELAQFLINLRYNNQFLSPKTRQMMYQNYLGFNDPGALDGNWDWGTGTFGAYHMHGGDLCYPLLPVPNGTSICSDTVIPRGVGTCIADFPNGTQAVLLINSRGGNYDYQCRVLKNAYEAAWVAK